mmetsp:Transcript_31556/g.40573  ORF Transcript_31556/g.40573 Transcript_31556/m.40573 type:complete len:95 (+) Transcript_31556:530-814(+)
MPTTDLQVSSTSKHRQVREDRADHTRSMENDGVGKSSSKIRQFRSTGSVNGNSQGLSLTSRPNTRYRHHPAQESHNILCQDVEEVKDTISPHQS